MSVPSEQAIEGGNGSRPRSRKWLIIAAAVALLLVLGAVAAYLGTRRSDPLASDPAGAQACHQLADWINGDLKDSDTGKPLTKIVAADALAQYAIISATPAIKAAAGKDLMNDPDISLLKAYGGPETLYLANLPALHAACVGAGERMPAYAEPGA
jgi:hypothetical protein